MGKVTKVDKVVNYKSYILVSCYHVYRLINNAILKMKALFLMRHFLD